MGRTLRCAGGVVVLMLLCGTRMIAQTPPIDPYSLATVKAACGAEGVSASAFAKRAPVAAPALDPGKARIYVINESWKLIGFAGEPVLLGIDGKWFAANRGRHF